MICDILLVDDERWVRAALRWTVEQTGLGFRVAHECANGREALDWLQGNSVDLVLTDIRMPVMDGLVLTKELRTRSQPTDVIIISVHDDFPLVQQALRQGVSDYLLKPVETEQLSACLSEWLQKRNPPVKEVQDSPLNKALAFIASRMPGDVTLAETARHVHVNPCYLSQMFKQQTGVNFVDYVADLRIRAAKKLLTTTTLRIADIAERLCFADISYFSTQFKKHTGFTPTEYRGKNQAKLL
ncbi:MAG: response regulator [Sporomusaceae bacterium]|nr:response regulator [Sporomusaceae bacterium]